LGRSGFDFVRHANRGVEILKTDLMANQNGFSRLTKVSCHPGICNLTKFLINQLGPAALEHAERSHSHRGFSPVMSLDKSSSEPFPTVSRDLWLQKPLKRFVFHINGFWSPG
jgi:hypothetical protein